MPQAKSAKSIKNNSNTSVGYSKVKSKNHRLFKKRNKKREHTSKTKTKVVPTTHPQTPKP